MRNQTGFTLLELIIAVAIVGILAAVATPMYSGMVEKSRRSDAITTLLNMSMELEKWRAVNTTYTNNLTNIGYTSTSPEGYYTLAISNATANTYTITATATGAQASDSSCSTIVISQNGPDVGTAQKRDCWNK